MPLQVHEVQIGEHAYKISTLPLSKGRPLVRHAAAILGSIGAALKDSALMDDDGNVDVAQIGFPDIAKVVSAALDVLTDAKCTEIHNLISQHSEVRMYGKDGAEKWVRVANVADLHFAGDIIGWGTWVFHNMKLNAGDFLGLAQNIGGELSQGTQTQ